MSITTLGKRDYPVVRASSVSGYVDGEYIFASEEIIKIRANIQPSTASYRTKLLPEGDRNKEAITIYSNDWLYTAKSGTNTPIACDLIIYRGARWEVVVARPYGNLGEHCEALAIKLNDSDIERFDGKITQIT